MLQAGTQRVGLKPQNALVGRECACNGECITVAEFNLHSNPVSAFISWATAREMEDFCFTLDFCSNWGYCLCLPPLGPVLILFTSSLCQSSVSTARC